MDRSGCHGPSGKVTMTEVAKDRSGAELKWPHTGRDDCKPSYPYSHTYICPAADGASLRPEKHVLEIELEVRVYSWHTVGRRFDQVPTTVQCRLLLVLFTCRLIILCLTLNHNQAQNSAKANNSTPVTTFSRQQNNVNIRYGVNAYTAAGYAFTDIEYTPAR